MSSEPQPTPQGAPLPRHALGDEVPPPPEAPVLPGAVYPAEDAVLPGAAEVERPGTASEQPEPPPSHAAPPLKIKRTRTSGLWVAVGFFAIILLLLLIFILQNGAQVNVNYLGAHGHLPLGVALLLSAVCGVLLSSWPARPGSASCAPWRVATAAPTPAAPRPPPARPLAGSRGR